MKITVKEKARTICSNNHNIHNYFGWPSVARLQDNSLAMVASGFRLSHICPFGKLIMCKSFDEGKTWTRPAIVLDTPLDDRDGGICPFGEKGLFLTSFNNHVDFQRNHTVKRAMDDHGEYRLSYLDSVEKVGDFEKFLGSTLMVSNDMGVTFEGPYIVPISSPHGPCVLSDGTVLYVGSNFNDNHSGYHIECHELKPDGTTVLRSKIKDVAENLLSCEPYAIQLPSGRILVHIRVERGGYFTIFQSVSDDMGYTFSEPVQLLENKGGSPAHIIRHSSGTVVSVYGYREQPYGIRAMFSSDNGESWDTDNVIIDDSHFSDLGYPCSVELENSDILTVFYDHEGDSKHAVIKSVIWNFEKED